MDVHKTIHVRAPVEEVFRVWNDYAEFPRFMTHVREVTLDGGRSRWVVDGPLGLRATWNAEVTAFEANRLLAWRSLPGSRVENRGVIRFEPQPDGTTRLDIRLSYNPPGGALGHGVARLLGADPKHSMDDDLLRFKSLVEEGKATARGHTVTREELRIPPPA